MNNKINLDSLFQINTEETEVETSSLKLIADEFIKRNDVSNDTNVDDLRGNFLYFLSSKTAHNSKVWNIDESIDYIRLILEEKEMQKNEQKDVE